MVGAVRSEADLAERRYAAMALTLRAPSVSGNTSCISVNFRFSSITADQTTKKGRSPKGESGLFLMRHAGSKSASDFGI